MKFSIRDLFLVTVIVALVLGWWLADDELCRTLPPAEAAARTGRTIKAVYGRRWALGMHDGSTKRRR